jgi:uncharacterized protein (TIGR02598 family)
MVSPVSKRIHSAFTLIEVTIALGIAAFAVVAVFGTLSTGLVTLRDSIDEVVEANLVREIAAKASRSSFQQIDRIIPGGSSYFNEQGLPVERAVDASFKMEVEVVDAILPGASSPSKAVKLVLVKISRQPHSSATTQSIMVRPIYVANAGF